MIIRRSHERGRSYHGWLRSQHTFSFADYYDPRHSGYRSLLVLNEDQVDPGRGFGDHGHREMEIISYVLAGELAHKDSTGTSSVIRPGDVQRMSAGTGVIHSEFNNSREHEVHFLQIWIAPERRGLEPSYEQKAFPVAERQGRLRLVASRDGRDGSLTVHQDVNLYASVLAPGERVRFEQPQGRHVWLHIARGLVVANGEPLGTGDAAAFDQAGPIELLGAADAELLLFDLA